MNTTACKICAHCKFNASIFDKILDQEITEEAADLLLTISLDGGKPCLAQDTKCGNHYNNKDIMAISSIESKEKLLEFVKSWSRTYIATINEEYRPLKNTYSNYERTQLVNALKHYIVDLETLCKSIEEQS